MGGDVLDGVLEVLAGGAAGGAPRVARATHAARIARCSGSSRAPGSPPQRGRCAGRRSTRRAGAAIIATRLGRGRVLAGVVWKALVERRGWRTARRRHLVQRAALQRRRPSARLEALGGARRRPAPPARRGSRSAGAGPRRSAGTPPAPRCGCRLHQALRCSAASASRIRRGADAVAAGRSRPGAAWRPTRELTREDLRAFSRSATRPAIGARRR